MSVNGIGSTQLPLSAAALATYAVGGPQGVGGVQSVQGRQAATQGVDADADGSSAGGPAASTHISRQGQLLARLQQLETQDPAKAKQVLGDVANKLTQAAQSTTGKDQRFLSSLADKFSKAANGDLSALQPPANSPGSPVASAYQQGAQTAINGLASDPLNPNIGQSQSAQTAINGLKSDPINPNIVQAHAAQGHHHHHHGGQGGPSRATQQTLQGVFQELNSALGGASSALSGASSPTPVPVA